MMHQHTWIEDVETFYVFHGWINYIEYCRCGAQRMVRKAGAKKEYEPL